MRRRLLILAAASLVTALMWVVTHDGVHVDGPNFWYSGGVCLIASNANFDRGFDFTDWRASYHEILNCGFVATWHDATNNSFKWAISIVHVHDLLTISIFAIGIAWIFLAVRPFTRRRLSPDASRLCATCKYDLTGNVSGVCPECGCKVSA